MIRTLPLDPNRLKLVSTGHCNAVAQWAELADGSRRPVPGGQAKNDDGVPLWVLDVIAPDEERGEAFGVQVATHDEPQVEQFKPVVLDGLCVRVVVGRDGKLKQYWSADRVVGMRSVPSPTPAPQPARTGG